MCYKKNNCPFVPSIQTERCRVYNRNTNQIARWSFWVSLKTVCFDGLEPFLVYKLHHKEAAPDGNAVYFRSK